VNANEDAFRNSQCGVVPFGVCSRTFDLQDSRLIAENGPNDVRRNAPLLGRYSKLSENLELRRTWCERVGTGLDLSSVTIGGPTAVNKPKRVKKEKFPSSVEVFEVQSPVDTDVAQCEPYRAVDSDLHELFFEPSEPVV
jgi:hypothetical protein